MYKYQITVVPPYYQRYIDLAPDTDIITALDKMGVHLLASQRIQLIELRDRVYAPQKWTVRTILQHIIDTERIFAYRALRLARHDQTPLPGFDENEYANAASMQHRTVDNLLEELALVRQTTLCLFSSFQADELLRTARCSGNEICVLALGFAIVGHLKHHVEIIKDRYYPLLETV